MSLVPGKLFLPTEDEMGNCKFLLPGPKINIDMQETFDDQRSEMHLNKNKNGVLGKSNKGMGDTPSLEYRFRGDVEAAIRFSSGELIANMLDVPALAGVLEGRDITYVTNAENGTVSLTRGDGEGFAGFAPTDTGIVIWNLSAPFCPSALVRGGNDRPKRLSKLGTGGYNCGLKQAVKNFEADNTKLCFEFYGYDGYDERAKSKYEWKPETTAPHTIKFLQNPTMKSKRTCNVPILLQTLDERLSKKEKGQPAVKGTPGFAGVLHARFAYALSTFMRVYRCDETAGPVMSGMHGAKIMHRDCFSLLLPAFGKNPLVLPPGPLVLVGERFYPVSLSSGVPLTEEYRKGLGSLIVRLPGKGMRDPYDAFSDEARQITIHTFTKLVADLIFNIIHAAERVCNRESLTVRKELATQLKPLLMGGESPIFGAVRGQLIDTLMGESRIKNNIDMLRNLLVREQLRGSPQAAGLSEDAFEKKIVMKPLVHSGNVARATVLAHLVGTFHLFVDSDKVHSLLYQTTNMQAAERRAAEAVHSTYGTDDRNELPEGLKEMAEYVLGSETKLRLLSLPEEPHLRNAAVPFRTDNDATGVHLAVMWERTGDPSAQIKEICTLRVTGVKQQVYRSHAVLEALNSPECAGLDTAATCFKILELLRAGGDKDDDDDDMCSDLDKDDKGDDGGDDGGGGEDNQSESESESESGGGGGGGGVGGEEVDERDGGGGGGGGVGGDEEVDERDGGGCGEEVVDESESGGAVDVLDVGVDDMDTSESKDDDDKEQPPSKKQRKIKYETEAGTDVLENNILSLSRTVTVDPSGKCVHKEPLPGEDIELTHVNQKIVTMSGYNTYVPHGTDDVISSETLRDFIKLRSVYFEARVQVVKLLGFGTTKVAASWSPDANWHGLFLEKENLVLINLAAGSTTLGQFEGVMLHELAHAKTPGCGHNLVWSSKLEDMSAAFADAKYAANGTTH